MGSHRGGRLLIDLPRATEAVVPHRPDQPLEPLAPHWARNTPRLRLTILAWVAGPGNRMHAAPSRAPRSARVRRLPADGTLTAARRRPGRVGRPPGTGTATGGRPWRKFWPTVVLSDFVRFSRRG